MKSTRWTSRPGAGPAKVDRSAHPSDGAQLVHSLAVCAYPFLSDWAAATERHCPRAADPCSAAGIDSRAGNRATLEIFASGAASLLLAGLTAVTAVIASVQVGLGRYASELVVAVMWKRVLRVATRVDLRKFESARFYDRLQRVQANALTRPYQITHGLVATAGSAAASVALAIAIVLVHPALLPLLLVEVPVLLTSRRQSQLEFEFLAQQTHSMRLRTYLSRVQTGRDEAKEVRAFGLARNFGTRLNTLYADYLRDLAQHLWRRSRLGAAGSLGSAVLLALTSSCWVADFDRAPEHRCSRCRAGRDSAAGQSSSVRPQRRTGGL